MACGSVTISRIFMRPPHFEQTVTSTAKTRARRLAQPMHQTGAPSLGKSLRSGAAHRRNEQAMNVP